MPIPFTRLASAALAAALLTLGALPAARAQIVYTNPADLTFTNDDQESSGYIIFNFGTGGGTGSATISDAPSGTDFLLLFADSSLAPNVIGLTGAVASDPPFYAQNITLGSPIDANLAFPSNFLSLNSENGGNNANWAAGTTGYLGFQFDGGAGTNYGWAQVSYNSDQSLTLHDFAYEASGGAILAGATGSAIPEPSTYAAFAGLLAGIVAFQAKRRRQRSGDLPPAPPIFA